MKDSPQSIWFTHHEKPCRFANAKEAQVYLDALPSRAGIEFIQAPLLFQLLNSAGAPLANLREIAEEISSEFGRTSSSDRRADLLQLFKSVMDLGESAIHDEEFLKRFREARERYYNSFIVQESVIDGDICIETLHDVTTREVAAGRMARHHSLRKLAEQGIGEPHFTRAELLARASLKLQAASPPLAQPRCSAPVQPLSIWKRIIAALRRS